MIWWKVKQFRTSKNDLSKAHFSVNKKLNSYTLSFLRSGIFRLSGSSSEGIQGLEGIQQGIYVTLEIMNWTDKTLVYKILKLKKKLLQYEIF